MTFNKKIIGNKKIVTTNTVSSNSITGSNSSLSGIWKQNEIADMIQNKSYSYYLDGSSIDKAAPSAIFIKNLTGTNLNGFYWINIPSLGPRSIYCLMDSNIDGGGWMSLTSEIAPQVSNSGSSVSWQVNSSNLITANPNIIYVYVQEKDCGLPSHYELRSPIIFGLNYTNTLMLMYRVSTIGQCSGINNQTYSGWYNGPNYNGTSTSAGMCTWGDGYFAPACCGNSPSGLKAYWVLKGSANSAGIRYKSECAGGAGYHYHMWFVK